MGLHHPGGPEVSASVKAYFTLKLVGDRAEARTWSAREDPRLAASTRVSFTKIYLSIFGQYDGAAALGPPELVLLPSWFYVNLYEMSSWSRAILVRLSISARRPRCACCVAHIGSSRSRAIARGSARRSAATGSTLTATPSCLWPRAELARARGALISSS
jgi:hypothetical protein